MVELNAARAVLLNHVHGSTVPTAAEQRRASGAKSAVESARRAYLDELRTF